MLRALFTVSSLRVNRSIHAMELGTRNSGVDKTPEEAVLRPDVTGSCIKSDNFKD